MSDAPEPEVTLREVTADNLGAILALEVAEPQRCCVASNAKSIAQAHYHEEAWFRSIYAGETPVGFIMLHDEHLRAEPREVGYYFLWRLMIDQSRQGRGIGRRAVELVIEHVRTRPHATRLLTSCVEGPASPEGFYLKLGFTRTGKVDDGEVELELPL